MTSLKILPPEFAADPDRVARFRREAQVLAALNHPNIAQIHGFEDAGGVQALVLELFDGRVAKRLRFAGAPLTGLVPRNPSYRRREGG